MLSLKIYISISCSRCLLPCLMEKETKHSGILKMTDPWLILLGFAMVRLCHCSSNCLSVIGDFLEIIFHIISCTCLEHPSVMIVYPKHIYLESFLITIHITSPYNWLSGDLIGQTWLLLGCSVTVETVFLSIFWK